MDTHAGLARRLRGTCGNHYAPLHYAASRGAPAELVARMIDAGADPAQVSS
eukprot:gene3355-1961_t